jgi:hypothetical protein
LGIQCNNNSTQTHQYRAYCGVKQKTPFVQNSSGQCYGNNIAQVRQPIVHVSYSLTISTSAQFIKKMSSEGARFLIKLTKESQHELALRANTMIILIVGSAVCLPFKRLVFYSNATTANKQFMPIFIFHPAQWQKKLVAEKILD